MNILKKYQFWLSVIFTVIMFIAIYPLSSTSMAYYILGFVALSIVGFGAVLYYALTKSFTRTNVTKLIWFTGITALPHILFSLLTYGSWVCLGISVVIIILLFKKRKFLEN